MSVDKLDETIVRDPFERDLSRYWEEKQNDQINLLLGAADGYYHHHFGIGDFDRSLLGAPADRREQRVLAEMHRLENSQVEVLIEAMGDVAPGSRVLDMGSGRGGTSFMIRQRHDVAIDGVTFAQYQVDFANREADQLGYSEVRFHYQNMVLTDFPDASFDYVVTNETTPYAKLDEFMPEIARVLRPGGRYVCATWARNDSVADTCSEVARIDKHYICRTHRRSSYYRALAENGLLVRNAVDYTREAIPYFEVRMLSELATGAEPPYLDGYRSDRVNYMVITADRLRS